MNTIIFNGHISVDVKKGLIDFLESKFKPGKGYVILSLTVSANGEGRRLSLMVVKSPTQKGDNPTVQEFYSIGREKGGFRIRKTQ